MAEGTARRASAGTALNERSSRSHSVVTVFAEGVDGAGRVGRLHLIDLAGPSASRARKPPALDLRRRSTSTRASPRWETSSPRSWRSARTCPSQLATHASPVGQPRRKLQGCAAGTPRPRGGVASRDAVHVVVRTEMQSGGVGQGARERGGGSGTSAAVRRSRRRGWPKCPSAGRGTRARPPPRRRRRLSGRRSKRCERTRRRARWSGRIIRRDWRGRWRTPRERRRRNLRRLANPSRPSRGPTAGRGGPPRRPFDRSPRRSAPSVASPRTRRRPSSRSTESAVHVGGDDREGRDDGLRRRFETRRDHFTRCEKSAPQS